MDIVLGVLLGFFFTEIERRRHPVSRGQSQPLNQQKILDLTYATDQLQQQRPL